MGTAQLRRPWWMNTLRRWLGSAYWTARVHARRRLRALQRRPRPSTSGTAAARNRLLPDLGACVRLRGNFGRAWAGVNGRYTPTSSRCAGGLGAMCLVGYGVDTHQRVRLYRASERAMATTRARCSRHALRTGATSAWPSSQQGRCCPRRSAGRRCTRAFTRDLADFGVDVRSAVLRPGEAMTPLALFVAGVFACLWGRCVFVDARLSGRSHGGLSAVSAVHMGRCSSVVLHRPRCPGRCTCRPRRGRSSQTAVQPPGKPKPRTNRWRASVIHTHYRLWAAGHRCRALQPSALGYGWALHKAKQFRHNSPIPMHGVRDDSFVFQSKIFAPPRCFGYQRTMLS